jgi:hypothetical protein
MQSFLKNHTNLTFQEIIHTFHGSVSFSIATIGCGISHKDTKHTDKCSNNKTKTFSKYCEDNTKKKCNKVYTYYTRSIQHTVAKKTLYTHYESFLNVRNSSTE